MAGFAVQVYCDFSGYTDMAIGSAVMLGVRLPANFDRPFATTNLFDLWRRWHITLSNWLRDYLYIPLGGGSRFIPRLLVNIFITMTLGGLWHGAAWTFVLWGAAHGAGLVVVHAIGMLPFGKRFCRLLPVPVKWAMTFGFFVYTVALFRALDLADAQTVMTGALFAPVGSLAEFARTNMFVLTLLAIFAVLHRFDTLRNVRFVYRKILRGVLFVVIAAIWALAVAAGVNGTQDFIYFDF
jgi:D-alanyl-lipoteichoic acid acyltransferase DltB (MBOAT superfamily)